MKMAFSSLLFILICLFSRQVQAQFGFNDQDFGDQEEDELDLPSNSLRFPISQPLFIYGVPIHPGPDPDNQITILVKPRADEKVPISGFPIKTSITDAPKTTKPASGTAAPDAVGGEGEDTTSEPTAGADEDTTPDISATEPARIGDDTTLDPNASDAPDETTTDNAETTTG